MGLGDLLVGGAAPLPPVLPVGTTVVLRIALRTSRDVYAAG